MFSKLENRYFLHNALAVYKKTTLKKFPFDENLTSKEDRYWANKIIKKKMNFIYDPKLKLNINTLCMAILGKELLEKEHSRCHTCEGRL